MPNSSVIFTAIVLLTICWLIVSLRRINQLRNNIQHNKLIIGMLSEELADTSNQCDKLMQENKTLHAVLDYHEKEVSRLKETLENYEHYEL